MIWLLAVHIITLLVWCGSLLYLPILIAGIDARQTHITLTPKQHDSVARFLFTLVATPSGLVAILSGSAVFLLAANPELWLIAKLTLVVALVVTHSLVGLLVLRAEHGQPVRIWCGVLLIIMALLMTAITTLVLMKPAFEVLPWQL